MRTKGLKVIEIPKWGDFLRQQWCDAFASHQGYIKQLENDLLLILNVTKFGEFDGESYFKLENIDNFY